MIPGSPSEAPGGKRGGRERKTLSFQGTKRSQTIHDERQRRNKRPRATSGGGGGGRTARGSRGGKRGGREKKRRRPPTFDLRSINLDDHWRDIWLTLSKHGWRWIVGGQRGKYLYLKASAKDVKSAKLNVDMFASKEDVLSHIYFAKHQTTKEDDEREKKRKEVSM